MRHSSQRSVYFVHPLPDFVVDNYDTGGLTIWPQCCNDTARPDDHRLQILSAIKPASRKGRGRSGPGNFIRLHPGAHINCCRLLEGSSPANSLRNVVAIAAGTWCHAAVFSMASFSPTPTIKAKSMTPRSKKAVSLSGPPWIVVRSKLAAGYHYG